MNAHPVIVAIDGPAGSGKSTTARRVAEKLGFLYLDTGAMYRAVALALHRVHADPAHATALPEGFSLHLSHGPDGEMQVWLGDENVSRAIRAPEMGGLASVVSALPWVRDAMVALQREVAGKARAAGQGVVLDGRDIGTVVFPDAEVKIFMVADSRERARRRHAELVARGAELTVEEVEADLVARDTQDATRAVAPLRPASDVVHLDTTALAPEDQVDFVVRRVLERR